MRADPSAVVLLRGDALRLAAALRRPSLAVWAGWVVPALLLTAGLRAVGTVGDVELDSTQGGVTLGVLLGGAIGFVSYGVLFRAEDTPFLRRLGIPAAALYRERALRLLGWTALSVLLAVVACTAAGVPAGRVLGVAVPAAIATWGAALLSFSGAARRMARRRAGESPGLLAVGMWDREVAGAAPLVYAPLLPLLVAGLGGGISAGLDEGAGRVRVIVIAVGLAAAFLGRGRYCEAMPRFGPQALEMSVVPVPSAEGMALRPRRGLSRLLPRRAGAVWARDSAIAARRFAWASRVTWPVVIFAFVALARWGGHPAARSWVVAAASLVLLLQAGAAVGLGRLERTRRRWIDRGLGISPVHRFIGRWAWGWGLSLWMTVPLALAWSWWSQAGPGWPWIAVAAGTAAAGAGMSVLAGGWR